MKFSRIRRLWKLLHSDVECIVCNRKERPWRRPLSYQFGTTGLWAYVCDETCWDALDKDRSMKL